ncbi:Oidioi.mRNA.OKI2018_I69.XSR.g16487.t1.cds [Oikopleura dioica]|uniref:Oidioi.mRNA.OKI2018_I69.XSR.g16487.t1.cds n=1 Tax=Oikopleura dioica TaxID=34765 RepID=A0ABN7SG86_OIKDI|nr:Oidioi.mRNA.OKI2018_I69.XSR.g16487.t1.cds [Oikopleura dioica]
MRSKKRSSSGESEQFDEATLEFSRAVKELSFEVLDAGLEPFPELPKTPIRKSRFSLKASAKRAFSKVTGRSNKRKKKTQRDSIAMSISDFPDVPNDIIA